MLANREMRVPSRKPTEIAPKQKVLKKIGKLIKFNCMDGNRMISVIGRLFHFFLVLSLYCVFLVVNTKTRPEGIPFFNIFTQVSFSYEKNNYNVQKLRQNNVTDWTENQLMIEFPYHFPSVIPYGVYFQCCGMLRLLISCFVGYELHGLMIQDFHQVLLNVCKQLAFYSVMIFPWQIFTLRPMQLNNQAILLIQLFLYFFYSIRWVMDFYILKEKIGIIAYVIFFAVIELEVGIVFTTFWMSLPGLDCFNLKDFNSIVGIKMFILFCKDNLCEVMNLRINNGGNRSCLSYTWYRTFPVGLTRFPVPIPPKFDSVFQEPFPGSTIKYLYVTGTDMIVWRRSFFYILAQIRSIGLGPFFPTSIRALCLISVAIIFGMIWNIWIFYGLMGGWWQDRTSALLEFEDQQNIIETYIRVSRQNENSQIIKRYAHLSYHQKNDLEMLVTYNNDLTEHYRDEIVFKLSLKAMLSTRIFYNIDAIFLNAIAYQLRPTLFIRGEIVVGGSKLNSKGFFYIRKGEVYVICFNGTIGHMAHLIEGDYFGETNLHKIGLKGASHVTNLLVIAASDCDMLLLKNEDYAACCRCFPKAIISKLTQNYKMIMRAEKFPTTRKIKTFQPEKFYNAAISYMKTRDPNVWIDVVARSKVNIDVKMKETRLEKRWQGFHLFAAVVGVFSPFITIMDLIPFDWINVISPNNIGSALFVFNRYPKFNDSGFIFALVLTQIVVLVALIDLIIWVYTPVKTDFGMVHVPLKEKCLSREFFIRFSKMLFIAIMWRKVVKVLHPLLTRKQHLMLFIITVLFGTVILCVYLPRYCFMNIYTDFPNISLCNLVEKNYGFENENGSRFQLFCNSIFSRFNLDPMGFFCEIGTRTQMRVMPIKLINFEYESQLHHDFHYILELQKQCNEEKIHLHSLPFHDNARRVENRRMFSFIYYLVTITFGVGDESAVYPGDILSFGIITFLASWWFVFTMGQVNGYVSAFYSIRTANRVKTTSWLRDLKTAMIERHINEEYRDNVSENILHFINDFNRISCKDDAYLLQRIPLRMIQMKIPQTWQCLGVLLKDVDLKKKLLSSMQWQYFTPGTRLGTLGDIVDDYFLLAKGIVIQIDGDNNSWKTGSGSNLGLISYWTGTRSNTMISLTYVQVARMCKTSFEKIISEHARDNYVYHYVKGVMDPLIINMKIRTKKDRITQIRHEAAVDRFTSTLASKQKRLDTRLFILLKQKYTENWNTQQKLFFMAGHFFRISYFEEVIAYIKLIKTLSLLWVLPLMYFYNIFSLSFQIIVGIIGVIAFLASYIDFHTPFWIEETGVEISVPTIIFNHWFKRYFVFTILMKFPFETFFLWCNLTVVNGIRLIRLWHFFDLMGKLGRIKANQSAAFGTVMQAVSVLYTVLFIHVISCFWLLLTCYPITNFEDGQSCTRCRFFEWRTALMDLTSFDNTLKYKNATGVCDTLEKKVEKLSQLKSSDLMTLVETQLSYENSNREFLSFLCTESGQLYSADLQYIQMDFRSLSGTWCHPTDNYCAYQHDQWFDQDFLAASFRVFFGDGVPVFAIETECIEWWNYYALSSYWAAVFVFGIGLGDISSSDWKANMFLLIVILMSSLMKSLILAQFASPIIDEEAVNYDLYCRIRNEKKYLKDFKMEKQLVQSVETTEEIQMSSNSNILMSQKYKLPETMFHHLMYKACEDLFKRMGIYDKYSIGALKLLASQLIEKAIPQGEILVRDGDIVSGYVIVKEGFVRLTGCAGTTLKKGRASIKSKRRMNSSVFSQSQDLTVEEPTVIISEKPKKRKGENPSIGSSIGTVLSDGSLEFGPGTCLGCPEIRPGSKLSAFIHIWRGTIRVSDHTVVMILRFESIEALLTKYPEEFSPILEMLTDRTAMTVSKIMAMAGVSEAFTTKTSTTNVLLDKEKIPLCKRVFYPSETPINICLLLPVLVKAIVYPFYINEILLWFSKDERAVKTILIIFLIVCNTMTILEIWIRSRLAYYDKAEKRLISDMQKIHIHYIRKRFPWDFIALLPTWVIHFTLMSKDEVFGSIFIRISLELFVFSIPIWIDLFQMRYYLNNARQEQPASPVLKHSKKIVRFIVFYACMVSILAAAWVSIGCIDKEFDILRCRKNSWTYFINVSAGIKSKFGIFLSAFYFIVNLGGNGRGDILPHNTFEMVFVALAIFLINFLLVYNQAHVGAMVYIFTMRSRIYQMNKAENQAILKMYDAEPNIHDRVQRYLKMSVNYYEHHRLHTLFNNLNLTLKKDVVYPLCEKFFDQLPMLDSLSSGILRQLSLCVREQLFLPGDTVIDIGETNSRAFYIAKGEGYLIDKKKKVKIVHTEEVVAKDALLMAQESVVKFKAKTFLALYSLSQDDFMRWLMALADAGLLQDDKRSAFVTLFETADKQSVSEVIDLSTTTATYEEEQRIEAWVNSYWLKTQMDMARSRRERNEKGEKGLMLRTFQVEPSGGSAKTEVQDARTTSDWQNKYEHPSSELTKRRAEDTTTEPQSGKNSNEQKHQERSYSFNRPHLNDGTSNNSSQNPFSSEARRSDNPFVEEENLESLSTSDRRNRFVGPFRSIHSDGVRSRFNSLKKRVAIKDEAEDEVENNFKF